ncbi:MAG: hypothetical protein IJQ02_07180 [Oscillospiraceae bacterium]|nr:hypothetical protein [Oscillospiraceae bacterium]
MGNKVHVDLGVNAAFMTRRYEEPESWARIISGLGFDFVSFDSDALDWFYSGDRDYILRTAKETRCIFENAGLKIVDYLTGVAPYRFFGLAHKDPEARAQMYRWVEGAIEIAAALGAESVSGRFDAFSVEVQAEPEAFQARYGELLRQYQALALKAKQRGLSAIGIEQMYVPSLIPYTIAGTKKYFADVNKGNEEGAVIRPIVDTGHACGQNYGVSGDDLYYEKWLEEFGVLGNTVHIQQSRRTGSDHAPFARDGGGGDVKIDQIIRSIKYSAGNYGKNVLSGVISVPENIYLILEALPSTADTEETVLDSLQQSIEYLRTAVPKGGFDISIS